MKKMLVGFGILAVLFIASFVNSIYLEKELHGIQEEVASSYSLSDVESKKVLNNSFQSWESMGKYAKSTLSDSKCERISQVFFECISEPNDIALKDKLLYEINSLIESEKVSFTSIL